MDLNFYAVYYYSTKVRVGENDNKPSILLLWQLNCNEAPGNNNVLFTHMLVRIRLKPVGYTGRLLK